MPRTELERTVQPSLLDRLTNLELDRPADPQLTREASVQAFRASVQRDVEWLLNTRRSIVDVPAAYVNVLSSVHEYGLPDTTGIAPGTASGREALVNLLQDTVERFEPRLRHVRVKITESEQRNTPQIRFSMEALLVMDPSPEQVVFDTVLEVASGEYDVHAGAGAPAAAAMR